jgi:oxygen-independent coproporphyrinogen III oxidase
VGQAARQERAPEAEEDLIVRYGNDRVPRYTSYPTAPHFSAAVTAADYADWLGELRSSEPISLYLHVPFCDRMCWYCGCHTSVVHQRGPIIDYTNRLIEEIGLVAAVMARRPAVTTIHFGGGTPNMLAPDDLVRLFEALHRHFDILPNAEIAAELDPRVLTQPWIDAARAQGFNRASLGVQDANPDVQKVINRLQSTAQVRWSVEALRAAGFASVNLDIMYGLPHQTDERIATTVAEILRLAPDRIALFGYAHVPWMKAHQKLIAESTLPDVQARLRQQQLAAAMLMDAGYLRVGLDHFARPGDRLALALNRRKIRRNFQGYTTDLAETLIGFGASAIGRLPRGYVQNAVPVPQWRAALNEGRLPTARGIALTAEDRLRAAIIERLMCDGMVDLREVCLAHDAHPDVIEPDLLRLETLETDGLVRRRDRMIEITPRGRPFVRSVCAIFDGHLNRSSIRHAHAI